ncbi:endoglucanase [Anaerotaenia torta]|uniref:glycoside hydrolase family 5 protein n=1 Tax=Anaerotaenia torta TaxID=433293 RepID=UPI003D20EC95
MNNVKGKRWIWMLAILLVLAMSMACGPVNSGEKIGNGTAEGNLKEADSKGPEIEEGEEKISGSEVTEATKTPSETEDAASGSETKASEEKDGSEEAQAPGEKELQEMRDITSLELVKEIKIGWNLGNTMDATGGTGINSELSWGNPMTKKEMVDTLKAAGFNVLRVPTTWEKHLGPAPDYKIDEKWLSRVRDIIDYGIDNDMFVILNMHHEEWHFPSYENEEAAIKILTAVWKQIANCFEGYDEHLIFEGLNEPRQKGTPNEWNGGNKEGWDVVNQFNAAFIETIRNAGGNNPLRHLMIPPYAAAASTKTWSGFTIPEDDKVIVSIHAYTPYNFTLNLNGTSEWSREKPNDKNEIDGLMSSLDKFFISKGIPVIIGEFGAMNKENIEARTDWAEYYIKKAGEIGIPCIWWDNGAFSGEGELFGLLDRRNLSWKYPEIVDALMKGAAESGR